MLKRLKKRPYLGTHIRERNIEDLCSNKSLRGSMFLKIHWCLCYFWISIFKVNPLSCVIFLSIVKFKNRFKKVLKSVVWRKIIRKINEISLWIRFETIRQLLEKHVEDPEMHVLGNEKSRECMKKTSISQGLNFFPRRAFERRQPKINYSFRNFEILNESHCTNLPSSKTFCC